MQRHASLASPTCLFTIHMHIYLVIYCCIIYPYLQAQLSACTGSTLYGSQLAEAAAGNSFIFLVTADFVMGVVHTIMKLKRASQEPVLSEQLAIFVHAQREERGSNIANILASYGTSFVGLLHSSLKLQLYEDIASFR